MSSAIHLDNIENYLFRLTDLIESSNSINRNNRTVDAENLFCVLLNLAFGWKLINANEKKSNQDSFDLIDIKRNLHVQVTSNKSHLRKFTATVDAFKKKRLKKDTQLIVLFISRKCSEKILVKKQAGKLSYEAYDIPKLFKNIYYQNKTSQKLKAINKFLEAEMTPVRLANTEDDISESIKLPLPQVQKRNTGLYIHRRSLIEAIFSFGQIANGLLVGGPGVGKSFVIEELQRLCIRKKIPCVVIKINDLLDATDEEIKEHIGVTGINWIGALKKVQFLSNIKAFLIFDAFDTAKEERIKSLIIRHLQKAIRELSEKWSILVSARTFDAAKSTRLQDLFPKINLNKSVSCRYYQIPELSEGELLSCVQTNPLLRSTFEKCTPSLKTLLKVPYFLKLFERIVIERSKNDNQQLLSIETEEQLLKVFWNKRVIMSSDTDLFIRKLTNILATKENLTCRKESMVTDRNINVYDHLISLGILVESTATKQNLSFSHNILLDYAISIYLVREDAKEQIEYLRNNSKLPFLFRQSFIYFYSRLWNTDRPIFWKHYFETRSITEPLFRLFHQTVLNFVLGGFYNSVEQLTPIFSLSNIEEKGNIIRKTLEGVRFINKGVIRTKDFDLLLECSKHFSEFFVWELGFLTDKAISQLAMQRDTALTVKIAKTSANYLHFVLQRRKIPQSKWHIDTNGSLWGIQNVCKTFSVNKTVAKRLLKQVLLILKEEEFPIRYFYVLSDNILDLFSHDPEFGALVYRTLYAHNEVSDKETYLGNSAVMSLRSNRSQDFHSIHYKLEKDFLQLLELCPSHALPVGLEIANSASIGKHKSYNKQATFIMSMSGAKAKMISDYSFYESDHDKEHGPLSHLETVFVYFEKLVRTRKYKEVKKLVVTFVSVSEATTLWRRFLKFLMVHPKVFKKESFDILLNEAIYVCNETIYEAGELLKVLWTHLSKAEKIKIESVIESLSTSNLLKEEKELAIRRILRLLSCIPHKELKSYFLKQMLSENGGAKKNEPLVRHTSLQPYRASEQERLREAGVQPDNPSEMNAYRLIKAVEPFNAKYDHNNSDKPPKSAFEPLIPTVTELYQLSKNESSFNERLSFNCDYEVSRFAKVVARHEGKLNKKTRAFVEDVAFYYINHENYKEKEYEKGEIKNRWGAYSPTPRTAATLTFVHLLYSDKSGQFAPIMRSLISDNKQIVRFKALHAMTIFWHKHRDQFWKMLEERVQTETDGMCLHEIINSVCYDNIILENKSEVERIALLAGTNLFHSKEEPVSDVWQVYIVLLLKLLIKYNSAVASTIIYDNLNQKSFIKSLVFEITIVIDPHAKGNDYIVDPTKYDDLIQIFHAVLQNSFENIQANLKKGELKDDFEIIDSLIQQLYFTTVHGRKENKGQALDKQNEQAFYFKIKPLLHSAVNESIKVESGFMVAHTGYYFMQLLNHMLPIDPEFILTLSSDIVKCAGANNFTYDRSTLGEIVKLTEQILADHKEILSKPQHFNSLIAILDQFANSGWQEALELTWRLKEVF
jgi:DNA replication protein DnaC